MSFQTGFLLLVIAVLAVQLYRQRRETQREWQRVARMIRLIIQDKRPASFILHGNEDFRFIGLGLETLAEERERLHKQISLEEFNLQAILAGMSEGVMVVDTQRRVMLVNPAFLHAFDLKSAPINQSALQAVRNAAVESMIRTALDTGRIDAREIHLQRTGAYFAASAAPIRDRAGHILGAVAIFHDITRVRQLEQVRRDFVSNVSHELRTPLSIFQGYLEMLIENDELPPEERANTLLILQRHSRRLNLLVEDLLSLARLESRNVDFKLVPLELNQLLENSARDWQLQFRDKQVRLQCEIPSQSTRIMGEALRLEQVFSNLLANALHYTPEGGTVTLELEQIPSAGKASATPYGEAEIRVRDSGRGIPASDLPHIFERFYRADKARTREHQPSGASGTGLGLSIVKHIVLGHGGSVKAESVYERGTVIIIRLPIAPAPAPSLQP